MRSYLLCLFLLVLVFACEEEDDPVLHEVTYEVISDTPTWHGEYIDKDNAKICNCSQPLLATGWKYTFKVAAPFTAHLDATIATGLTDQPDSPSITTNIYVDGELVASNTDNWVKGVASADFEVR